MVAVVSVAAEVGCDATERWCWQLTWRVEPCDLRLLAPPEPGADLSSASESEVDTWDLRASFTEYLCAVLRDRLDFHAPPRAFLPGLGSSVEDFCPDRRGTDLASRFRNTSSRGGRTKSVNPDKNIIV